MKVTLNNSPFDLYRDSGLQFLYRQLKPWRQLNCLSHFAMHSVKPRAWMFKHFQKGEMYQTKAYMSQHQQSQHFLKFSVVQDFCLGFEAETALRRLWWSYSLSAHQTTSGSDWRSQKPPTAFPRHRNIRRWRVTFGLRAALRTPLG